MKNLWNRFILWLVIHTDNGRAWIEERDERNEHYFRLQNAATHKPRNPDVKELYEMLTDAGFKTSGTWITEHSAIRTFVTTDKMVLVQLHPDGTLSQVFTAINERNPAKIINKVTESNRNVTYAIDWLNELLVFLTLSIKENEKSDALKFADDRVRRVIGMLRNM